MKINKIKIRGQNTGQSNCWRRITKKRNDDRFPLDLRVPFVYIIKATPCSILTSSDFFFFFFFFFFSSSSFYSAAFALVHLVWKDHLFPPSLPSSSSPSSSPPLPSTLSSPSSSRALVEVNEFFNLHVEIGRHFNQSVNLFLDCVRRTKGQQRQRNAGGCWKHSGGILPTPVVKLKAGPKNPRGILSNSSRIW